MRDTSAVAVSGSAAPGSVVQSSHLAAAAAEYYEIESTTKAWLSFLVRAYLESATMLYPSVLQCWTVSRVPPVLGDEPLLLDHDDELQRFPPSLMTRAKNFSNDGDVQPLPTSRVNFLR